MMLLYGRAETAVRSDLLFTDPANFYTSYPRNLRASAVNVGNTVEMARFLRFQTPGFHVGGACHVCCLPPSSSVSYGPALLLRGLRQAMISCLTQLAAVFGVVHGESRCLGGWAALARTSTASRICTTT